MKHDIIKMHICLLKFFVYEYYWPRSCICLCWLNDLSFIQILYLYTFSSHLFVCIRRNMGENTREVLHQQYSCYGRISWCYFDFSFRYLLKLQLVSVHLLGLSFPVFY